MSAKKIVITGGPGTGKTSIINALKEKGYVCFPEISRQVTQEARQQGIEQLFLTDPILFSKKLLEGRKQQYLDAVQHHNNVVFLDRGLPDVLAYMDYIGDAYPEYFIETCKEHIYDHVFLLPPWKEIYTSDSERYESFEQAVAIHDYLQKTYERFGYDMTDVPTGTIAERTQYIIEATEKII